jgi:hypothetical protein
VYIKRDGIAKAEEENNEEKREREKEKGTQIISSTRPQGAR